MNYRSYYQDMNFLQHYGRKGMKWYRNIFSKEGRSNIRKNRIAKKKKSIMDDLNFEKAYKNRKYFTKEELHKLAKDVKDDDADRMLASQGSLNQKDAKRNMIQNADLREAYRYRKHFTTAELLELRKRHETLRYIDANKEATRWRNWRERRRKY